MNTTEIEAILEADAFTAPLNGGVWSIDTLPFPLPRERLYVCNLDPSTMQGSHWIGISTLSSQSASASASASAFYFDSFARPPPLEMLPQLLSTSDFVMYNDVTLQNPLTAICGQLTILVLKFLARRRTPLEVMLQFPFSENYIKTDLVAYSVIQSLSGLKNKPFFNWEYLMES